MVVQSKIGGNAGSRRELTEGLCVPFLGVLEVLSVGVSAVRRFAHSPLANKILVLTDAGPL